MQAWNSVKVTNEESLHAGRAGTVLRVEKRNDMRVVQVWLDEQGTPGAEGYKPGEMEPFSETELALL